MNLQNHEIDKIKQLLDKYKNVHNKIEKLEQALLELAKQRKNFVDELMNIHQEEENLLNGIAIRNSIKIEDVKENLAKLLIPS